MPIPLVNPSPKERFQSNREWVNAHRDMLLLPEFQRALDYALLQQGHNLSLRETPATQDAMGFYYEAKGASDLVKILKRLAEADHVQTKPVDRDNLVTQR